MYALVETKDSTINGLGVEVKGASYFICDGTPTVEGVDPDIEHLPTDKAVGSRALCIQSGNIYMFGPSKAWFKYKGVSILN